MESRDPKQEVREEFLREAVMAKLSPLADPDDAGVLAVIDEVLLDYSRRNRLPVAERARCRKRLFDSFRRLDVLQDLLEDESVTEIMVNGSEHIFLERGGTVERWPGGFSSTEKLEDVIQQIVSRVNRVVNTSSPIVDARLEDGSRVNVVLPPVAPDGPILTIRKFPKEPVTMEKLLAWESITEDAAEFLRLLVESGYNIFVSGGTSSGKTTFLNVLSRYIPADERVITIEDSLELQLLGIPNLVRMETRNASAGGAEAVRIRDLIRTALRMRPDRLVIGEVRGAEALDLLQAFNTGHDGSMSTAHANSPADMLSRLETMVLMGGDLPLPAVRQQIASAIEILVHLGRRRGARKVLSIVEVLRVEKGEIIWQPLFSRRRTEEGDRLVPEGRALVRAQKAMDSGGEELCHRLSQLLAVPEGMDPLLYRSLPAFFLLTPILAAAFPLRMREKLRERRLNELAGQFRDGAQALVAALAAGFAVENAFTEAAGEMEELYGGDGLITVEFREICRLISLNRSVEEAVAQFASRSGLAEIEQFAEVFGIARRSSGDLVAVLRETVSILTRKIDLTEEIRTLAAGRKLEQRIMILMPPAILIYVNLASPGFTDPLYEGAAGRLLMTGCLGIYALAVWLGEKILAVDI